MFTRMLRCAMSSLNTNDVFVCVEFANLEFQRHLGLIIPFTIYPPFVPDTISEAVCLTTNQHRCDSRSQRAIHHTSIPIAKCLFSSISLSILSHFDGDSGSMAAARPPLHPALGGTRSLGSGTRCLGEGGEV